MTNKIINPKDITYWIAYNEDKSVIHYGEVVVANCMETALEFVEVFLNESDYTARKTELGLVEEEELTLGND